MQQAVHSPQSRPGIRVIPSHIWRHCHDTKDPHLEIRRKYRSAIFSMSAPQNPFDSGDWRKLVEFARSYAQVFAIAMAVIAVPLALLYLTPVVLGLFAPRLDPNTDLYAVNRPVAFTFLDANGEDVGHRGAVVGERLEAGQMPRLSSRRLHRHGGSALLFP